MELQRILRFVNGNGNGNQSSMALLLYNTALLCFGAESAVSSLFLPELELCDLQRVCYPLFSTLNGKVTREVECCLENA